MSICAIVVTFNRLNDLKRNINSLESQSYSFDKIIIVNNNSTDGTYEWLNSLSNDIFIPLNLKENLCGAGGFYTGLKYAYDLNFDYFVLMDDDGYMFNRDTMKSLIEPLKIIKNKKVFLNPLVLHNENELSFQWYNAKNKLDAKKLCDNNFIIKDQVSPFNGTLVSKELIKEIGFPNKELIIRGDETDYENRAKKCGSFVGTVYNSLYYHPTVKIIIKKRFFKIRKFNVEDPWKEYYRARNYTLVYGIKIRKRIKKRIWRSFLLHDKLWLDRIKMIIHGLNDGKKGITGMVVNPGQNKWNKKYE